MRRNGWGLVAGKAAAVEEPVLEQMVEKALDNAGLLLVVGVVGGDVRIASVRAAVHGRAGPGKRPASHVKLC